jgi:hypothetical protein
MRHDPRGVLFELQRRPPPQRACHPPPAPTATPDQCRRGKYESAWNTRAARIGGAGGAHLAARPGGLAAAEALVTRIRRGRAADLFAGRQSVGLGAAHQRAAPTPEQLSVVTF